MESSRCAPRSLGITGDQVIAEAAMVFKCSLESLDLLSETELAKLYDHLLRMRRPALE